MNDIKERPILFSTEMVKAILREDSPKTMTRRIIKPQPEWCGSYWLYQDEVFMTDEAMQSHLFHNVYGDKGTPYGAVYADGTADRMWVKETWQAYTPGGRPYSRLQTRKASGILTPGYPLSLCPAGLRLWYLR
jgi:hypothetical protein